MQLWPGLRADRPAVAGAGGGVMLGGEGLIGFLAARTRRPAPAAGATMDGVPVPPPSRPSGRKPENRP